jgi:ElaB/YqjD/DUF883 family membrane-anchored ribosome-binding protein
MVTTIQSDAQSALDATDTLASDLKSLPPLSSDQATQAKQDLDKLATQAETTVKQTKTTVGNLPANASASETAKALAPLAPQLQSLATQASTTLSDVQAAGSSLKQGFQDADSCKQFRS